MDAAKSEPDRLAVEVERLGEGVAVVSVAGELDLGTVPQLEGAFFGKLQGNDVIVDLRQLSFVDSSGIGFLIKAHRATVEAGSGLLAVITDGSQVERVFSLAGIGKALPLYFDRDEAIAALGAAAPGD